MRRVSSLNDYWRKSAVKDSRNEKQRLQTQRPYNDFHRDRSSLTPSKRKQKIPGYKIVKPFENRVNQICKEEIINVIRL